MREYAGRHKEVQHKRQEKRKSMIVGTKDERRNRVAIVCAL